MSHLDVRFQTTGGILNAFIDFPGDDIYTLNRNLDCAFFSKPRWVDRFADHDPPPLILMTTYNEHPSVRLLSCGGADPMKSLAFYYSEDQCRTLQRSPDIDSWW